MCESSLNPSIHMEYQAFIGQATLRSAFGDAGVLP